MQMKETEQTERGTSLASPVNLLKNIIKTWSLEEEYITYYFMYYFSNIAHISLRKTEDSG